jgi:hypothetical protein
MAIVNRDGARHIRDGGDILELFKAATDENAVTVTEERLAAGHANRINESLLHVGRGVSILQALLRLAARRPNPQTSQVSIAHSDAPPAGPIADAAAGGPPMKTFVTGDVVIDGDGAVAALKEEYYSLVLLKTAILDWAHNSENGFVKQRELPDLKAKIKSMIAEGRKPVAENVVTRDEIAEITGMVLARVKALVAERLMAAKSSNGTKGGDLHV